MSSITIRGKIVKTGNAPRDPLKMIILLYNSDKISLKNLYFLKSIRRQFSV